MEIDHMLRLEFDVLFVVKIALAEKKLDIYFKVLHTVVKSNCLTDLVIFELLDLLIIRCASIEVRFPCEKLMYKKTFIKRMARSLNIKHQRLSL